MSPDDLPSLDELAVLLPQYRFEHLLAEGGMGAVYRAEQISLGRHVAIKILPRSLTADETYREQFTTEARLMGQLTYPHIVAIHDFGLAGDVLYIVMELLEGTNLYERMHKEPLKLNEVVKIFSQVCDALTAAHHKGVVHRDVKPENIFIESGLQVKLGDFGIARQRRADKEGSLPQAAISGLRLGTPEYAAPELFDFQKHIDHRADIFSLGVVLYEALTGARPTGAFIAPSRRKPGVDRRFDDVVVRAMQSDPEDRYPNTEAMKKDILRILSPAAQPAAAAAHPGKTPTGQKGARPASAAAHAAKPAAAEAAKSAKPALKRKKKPVLLWGSIAGGAALAAVVVVALNRGDQDKNKTPESPGSKLADLPKKSESSPAVNPPDPSPRPTPPPKPRELGPPADEFPFGGHTYQFIPTRLSWDEAKVEAEKLGGYLACITSQEEHDALRSYLMPLLKEHGDFCWLGGSDAGTEGTWKWVTGEEFKFTAWASDAPNDGGEVSDSQDCIVWHRKSSYKERVIAWNDLNERSPVENRGAMLLEKGAVTPTPAPAPTPVVLPPPDPPTAAPAAAAGWRQLSWPESELAKLSDKLALTDGWLVAGSYVSLDAPAPVAFKSGAVRVRLRLNSPEFTFQIKARYAKSSTIICALHPEGAIKVTRRENDTPANLADWKPAERLKPGDEIRFEMRLTGKMITALLNGSAAGSTETGDDSPATALRISADGVSIKHLEWLPLDEVADPDKSLASPPAWPNTELAALASAFDEKKRAAYSDKLEAGIKEVRRKYVDHLRKLAKESPSGAAVCNAEADLVAGGGDLPLTGTHPVILTKREKLHAEVAKLEKDLVSAALGVWTEHLEKLKALENTWREARRLADLSDIAPLRSEAEAAVARFTTLAKPSR